MTTSFRKKRDAVLRRWRENQISLVDAAAALCALGFPPLEAWALLERT